MTTAAPDSLRIAAIMVGLRPDGGAEALLRTFAQQLASTPHELEVICFNRLDRPTKALLNASGLNHVEFPASRMISIPRLLRLAKRLRRYDVAQTNLLGPNVVGTIAARLAGIGSVAILHNTKTSGDDHWYHGKAESLVLQRLAKRVVAVGPRTKEARQPYLPNTEIHVLPNAVSPGPRLSEPERGKLREEIMDNANGHLLLNVGRLHPQKAQDNLIRALPRIIEQIPDAELVIAGTGDLQSDLTALIHDLGLENRVQLLGARNDVRSIMAASDLFVLPSHWEGLPVAMLEAMEAGVPVLATSVGDVPSVLGENAGWMIDDNRPESIADGVLRVHRSCEREQRVAEAQSLIDRKFNSQRWAAAMIEHLKAAC